MSRPPSAEPSSINQDQYNKNPDQSPNNSGLRRVCSLSDLTKQGSGRRMLPAPPLAGINNDFGRNQLSRINHHNIEG